MKLVISSLLITLGIIFTMGAFEQENMGILVLFGFIGVSMTFIGARGLSNE